MARAAVRDKFIRQQVVAERNHPHPLVGGGGITALSETFGLEIADRYPSTGGAYHLGPIYNPIEKLRFVYILLEDIHMGRDSNGEQLQEQTAQRTQAPSCIFLHSGFSKRNLRREGARSKRKRYPRYFFSCVLLSHVISSATVGVTLRALTPSRGRCDRAARELGNTAKLCTTNSLHMTYTNQKYIFLRGPGVPEVCMYVHMIRKIPYPRVKSQTCRYTP